MAIVLVFLIWLGRITGLYDPGGREFPETQDRHLTVSGTVTGREATAGGYRIILNSISFLSGPGDTYRSRIRSLNDRLRPSDKMVVFLSNGQEDEPDLYGNSQSDKIIYSKKTEDQTGLFMQLHVGDTAVFWGKCAQPEAASNPGQFDLRRYYHARNIYFTMRDPSLISSFRGKSCIWRGFLILRDGLCLLRYFMQKGLFQVFGQEDASYLAAMLLGDKSGLSEEKKQFFRDGGLAFLITVSSIHISFAGRAVFMLLRRLRRSFLFSSAISAFTVLCYVLFTGASVASQRACIMFLFWLGAQVLGRTHDRLTALGGAVIFILLKQPYALFDSSFQITCVCVLSLEFLPGAFSRLFYRLRQNRRSGRLTSKSLFETAVSSVSIQAGTLPVTLYWYYQIYPFAALLHPLLLGLMIVLLVFGLSGAFCGMLLLVGLPSMLRGFLFILSQLLAGPCHYLITFFLLICRLEQEIPYSSIILGRPHFLQIILYYVLLGAGITVLYAADKRWMKKNIQRIRIAGILTASFMFFVIAYRVRPAFRFTCLDIGQGSCNLIECGDYVCLFDAGSSTVSDVWNYRIDSTLKYFGISELDTVFLSHADLDHVNGIEQMLLMYHRNLAGKNAADVTIRQILLPDLPEEDERISDIRAMADYRRIPVGYVSEGAEFAVGDMILKVLGPSKEFLSGNANEDCIVLYASYTKLGILLTGDLEKDGESMLTERYDSKFKEDDICRILVAGHHGSGNATSKEMLDLVRPDLVLISCGKNNRYGHPAEEMLERLREYGVRWHRTDLNGAYCISIG